MDLFDLQNQPVQLSMPDADVTYYPGFFDFNIANRLFDNLSKSIEWQQDTITIYGKKIAQPRLTALYANNNKTYSYSNIKMVPHPFTDDLLAIKQTIEKHIQATFTTCLLNLYRDGQDSNGWHADDEKELGNTPTIASVSFGEERWFHFKHKNQKNLKKKILLQHGSLLVMKGDTQQKWLHQIPKTKKVLKPRINLTFRIIK
ncbi:alpha-ketoglutarate-dependent dioxygenase AlkB family protein [Aquimarina sp. 2201CG5-10]|uniref:alpha-ketoglutarate-dependent dioxygenase AlkB family protein n=1 Tax=Aquimarina callyspongiae TaxID=3098150 RepID=UPI002AB40821|nr:alpha-ketoglutarate-dependent dioxygenase AlkB [Aquimarina sp. 2201CG5-10]MDY8137884.1 alpha-ketoglutarate-dependent dioxygenase AlkB [Aquimarina sp. 2201CG5-10]